MFSNSRAKFEKPFNLSYPQLDRCRVLRGPRRPCLTRGNNIFAFVTANVFSSFHSCFQSFFACQTRKSLIWTTFVFGHWRMRMLEIPCSPFASRERVTTLCLGMYFSIIIVFQPRCLWIPNPCRFRGSSMPVSCVLHRRWTQVFDPTILAVARQGELLIMLLSLHIFFSPYCISIYVSSNGRYLVSSGSRPFAEKRSCCFFEEYMSGSSMTWPYLSFNSRALSSSASCLSRHGLQNVIPKASMSGFSTIAWRLSFNPGQFWIQDVSSFQDAVDLQVLIPPYGKKSCPKCWWSKPDYLPVRWLSIQIVCLQEVLHPRKVLILPNQWKIYSTYPPRNYDCASDPSRPPIQGVFPFKVVFKPRCYSTQGLLQFSASSSSECFQVQDVFSSKVFSDPKSLLIQRDVPDQEVAFADGIHVSISMGVMYGLSMFLCRQWILLCETMSFLCSLSASFSFEGDVWRLSYDDSNVYLDMIVCLCDFWIEEVEGGEWRVLVGTRLA